MFDHLYAYAARFDPQPGGGFLVSFPDLPEALTDGADLAAALANASDCLSEALAGRINHDEVVPPPRLVKKGARAIAPEPTIALKAALYSALRARALTVADLARRLDVDYRLAARLVDPRSPSKLSGLKAALDVLGYELAIAVQEKPAA